MKSTRVLAWLGMTAVALFMTGGVTMADEDPWSKIETAIESMAVMSKNARIKLESGASGFAIKPGDDPALAKPGQECCMMNLEAMKKDYSILKSSLAELARTFPKDGEDEGAKIVRQMTGELRAVDGGMTTFASASNVDYAMSGIKGVQGSVARLRSAFDRLVKCCKPDEARTNQQ